MICMSWENKNIKPAPSSKINLPEFSCPSYPSILLFMHTSKVSLYPEHVSRMEKRIVNLV